MASEHLQNLVGQLQETDQQDDAARQRLLSGTWRQLRSDAPESSALVAFFTGGYFVYEGSTSNGGLFKAVLDGRAPGAKLGRRRLRIAGQEMVASAEASFTSGHNITLSYSARLRPSQRGTFVQRIVSLDAPEPLGVRTPIMERHDEMTLSYVDSELMVWRDARGHYDVFVRVYGEDDA